MKTASLALYFGIGAPIVNRLQRLADSEGPERNTNGEEMPVVNHGIFPVGRPVCVQRTGRRFRGALNPNAEVAAKPAVWGRLSSLPVRATFESPAAQLESSANRQTRMSALQPRAVLPTAATSEFGLKYLGLAAAAPYLLDFALQSVLATGVAAVSPNRSG